MDTLPVRVIIPLPFCLRLRDGDYKIRFKEKMYLCRLRKVWSDFASGCDPDKHTGPINYEFLFKVTTGKITRALNCEIEFDKKGFFRHTDFSTTVYLDGSSKPEEIPHRVIHALIPLVNKLLLAYRYVTGEFHVTEIQWQELCVVRDGKIMPFVVMDFPTHGKQRKRVMGWFAGDESPLVITKHNVSKRDHKAIEKMLFMEDFQVPLERDLLLNAKDYSRQGRYDLAVFELGTALEVAINNLLLSKGVDEKELRYLYFKDKYNHVLRKHTGISLKEVKGTLFSDILKIWNMRSNVAHRRLAAFTDRRGRIIERIESKDQVKPLITSTEQTLNFLESILS